MNLDELQSVQSRERQASSLQHLRASFYEEAGEYIGELRAERNAAATDSDNPFDDPEVERLSDDIRTAERTVESIYERRVGKVVKLASIAAADMPYDDEGLTNEEEQLFGTLVDAIENNRECVLSVLDGESPDLDCTPADETAPAAEGSPSDTDRADRTGGASGPGDRTGTGGTDGVTDPDRPGTAPERPGPEPVGDADADGAVTSDPTPGTADDDRPTPPDRPPSEGAEQTATGPESEGAATERPPSGEGLDIGGAMGGADDDGRGAVDDGRPAPADPEPATPGASTGPGREREAAGHAGGRETGPHDGRDGDGGDGAPGDGPVERTTVRVTADVGEVFGVDGRAYDLSAEDVVTLPAPNADGLVSKDAAERLD
ncbi:MAG: hypothetical protein V5A85_08280 [Haloarculaceae archaeon]